MCVLIYFFLGPTKKMIQWVKNMLKFRGFLSIGSKHMWVPLLGEEESDSFMGENNLR